MIRPADPHPNVSRAGAYCRPILSRFTARPARRPGFGSRLGGATCTEASFPSTACLSASAGQRIPIPSRIGRNCWKGHVPPTATPAVGHRESVNRHHQTLGRSLGSPEPSTTRSPQLKVASAPYVGGRRSQAVFSHSITTTKPTKCAACYARAVTAVSAYSATRRPESARPRLTWRSTSGNQDRTRALSHPWALRHAAAEDHRYDPRLRQ